MRIFVNEFCGHPFGMELSRELARRGHDVFHAYFADNESTPKGSKENGSEIANLRIEGLHIGRPFNKHGLFSRRAADIEYGKAVAAAAKAFAPDVVISANMPLDGQRILQEMSHRCGARFVFWLQDIYSTAVRFVLNRKAPVVAGMGAWYYEQIEKRLLKKSDAIVCIAPAFAEYLAQCKVDGPEVAVIPNWAPLREIRPTAKNNAWSQEKGVAEKFCFMYSGTLGMKHRPELLLRLAKHLEARKNASLVVNAGGAGAEWITERQGEVSADALKVFSYQPYERMSEVFGAADVFVALLDSEAGSFAVPSKTLAYLCAGKPLIIAAPKTNEAAQVVLRANAGIVISPDHPEQITEAAESLLADPALCAELGRNARRYAERTFAIEDIAVRFLNIFEGGASAARALPAHRPQELADRTPLTTLDV